MNSAAATAWRWILAGLVGCGVALTVRPARGEGAVPAPAAAPAAPAPSGSGTNLTAASREAAEKARVLREAERLRDLKAKQEKSGIVGEAGWPKDIPNVDEWDEAKCREELKKVADEVNAAARAMGEAVSRQRQLRADIEGRNPAAKKLSDEVEKLRADLKDKEEQLRKTLEENPEMKEAGDRQRALQGQLRGAMELRMRIDGRLKKLGAAPAGPAAGKGAGAEPAVKPAPAPKPGGEAGRTAAPAKDAK